MRHLVRAITVGLFAVVVAVAVSGCGSSKPAAITVYSGQYGPTTALLAADFEKQTGIKVTVVSGQDADLATKIIADGANSPADVFYAKNPPPLNSLDSLVLFSPVDTATLTAVPKDDRPTDGSWVGVSGRLSAIVYNTDKVSRSQLPQTLDTFKSAVWKGKFGYAPTEGDFHPLVTALVLSTSESGALSWLRSIKANGKSYADDEALVAAVNRGDVELGLVDHYYWYRLREELGAAKMHSKLAYFPEGESGDIVAISGAGVLASSKHQKEAQQFLAYLVSEPAQTIIATSHLYEYPLAAGVKTKQLDRPLGYQAMTMEDFGDGLNELDLMGQAGVLAPA